MGDEERMKGILHITGEISRDVFIENWSFASFEGYSRDTDFERFKIMEAKSRFVQVESLQGWGEGNIQNMIKDDFSNQWKRCIFQKVGKLSTHLKEK